MTGRWPANVILSPEMGEVLDVQSGVTGAHGGGKPGTSGGYHGGITPGARSTERDAGGASRFFLSAGYEPWELDWIYSVGLKPCGMERSEDH